jgi:HJR/Mrr/RecB family endonuclease
MSNKLIIQALHNNDGWEFKFLEPALFSFLKAKPVESSKFHTASSQLDVVRIIRSILNEDGVIEKEHGIFVPDFVIANAEISPGQLEAIGLPPLCPFRIKISSEKPITDVSGKINITWLGANYAVPAVIRTGTLISTGSRRFLLRNPLVSLLEAVDKINNCDTLENRMRCFSQLSGILINITDEINFPDNFKEMTIYQATALGIDSHLGPDGYVFRPELLGDIPSEDDEHAPKRVSLLNRTEKTRFENRLAESQILGNVEARSCYVLGKNTYVVLDVGVQAAMKVVLEVGKSDRETRREFFEDKMSFLLPELEKVGADGSVIEFSDRVIGIKPWEGGGNIGGEESDSQWFPDQEATTFTFRDAKGNTIALSGDEIDSTIQSIREAYSAGRMAVNLNGKDISIDEAVLEDLERIAILRKPKQSTNSKQSEKEPKKYFFVKSKDNLKDLSYIQELGARRTANFRESLGLINEPQQHQIQGIDWLQQAYLSGLRGILMADDMGLGKTFQVLAFLRWLKLIQKENKPILIVAPKSLLGNWLDEVDLHLGEGGLGKPLLLFGKTLKDYKISEGRDIKLAREVLDIKKIRSANWVLTTYETLRDYQISMARVRFDVIVFDEAQKIKENGAMVTEAARSQNVGSLRILMTGTPVENGLMDLWTLFDVAWPGRLGYSGSEFTNKFIKDKQADLSEIRKILSEPSIMEGINLPPLMLRRMKQDVSELPVKHIRIEEHLMPKEQADAYTQIVEAKESKKLNMLSALQAARNTCLHPDLQAQIDYSNESSINNFINRSARLITTFRILDEIKKKNEKVLIFVDLRKAQSIIAEIIKTRYNLEFLPYVINGETTLEKRDQIRRGFQKRQGSFEVLLLGPKSAGFGLTLHAANHVIHLNRWWNPAVEDQCTDRAYRIGQKKEVFVYLPIAKHPDPRIGKDSYDLVLDELLKRKRRTSNDVISPVQFNNSDKVDLYSRIFGAEYDADKFDNMDWKRFEDYVLDQLIAAGYETNRTPKSGDAGADALGIYGKDPKKCIVVQVKHRSRGKLGIVSREEVLQVIQAKARYNIENAQPILVTNGSVEQKGFAAADWHGIKIIDHSKIRDLSEVLKNIFQH